MGQLRSKDIPAEELEKAMESLPKRNMVVPRDKNGHPIVKKAKITQDDADRLVRVARGDF